MSGAALAPGRRTVLVWAVALCQLVSWGSLYYAFSVLVVPMEQDLGWSRTDLNGALTAGLVTQALCAYPVGAWIDRRGAHGLMTIGSILAAVLLALWARVDEVWAFYAVWIAIGAVQAALFYEPAFAVLTANLGDGYRRGITTVTLLGGFASTVFIPLTQFLIDRIGWRDALDVLALCNLLICVALHAWVLRGTRGRAPAVPAATAASGGHASAGGTPLARAVRGFVFWALLALFAGLGAVSSVVAFHLFPLLTGRGVDTATIVVAAAMIGPMQVAGRMAVAVFGQRLDTRRVGIWVVSAMPAGVLVLWLAPSTLPFLAAFAVVYGSALGLLTILRGTTVAEFIGTDGYAAVNGALGLPITLARALAPFAAAALWAWSGGYDSVLLACLGLCVVGAFGFAVALRSARGRRAG